MRPAGHPTQECAATQRESQASQDGDAGLPPRTGHQGWGRLWPLTQALSHVDLSTDEVRLGRRPTCNVVFDQKHLPETIYGKVVTLISGDHCRIYRKLGTATPDDVLVPTFIEDLRCVCPFHAAFMS